MYLLYISVYFFLGVQATEHKETPNTAVDIYLYIQGYYRQAPGKVAAWHHLLEKRSLTGSVSL